MLNLLSGKVKSYQAVSKRTVQVELEGVNKLIEITTFDPWVIRRGDDLIVAGEVDGKSGKFIGYAYKNRTRGVSGCYEVSTLGALLFIFIGFALLWAVFPIIHIYLGFKMLGKKRKCARARQMILQA